MSSSFSVVKPSYLENTSNIVVNGNLTVNGTVSTYLDTSLNSLPENTISLFGNFSGVNKWHGGVLAPNGKIYCVPRDSTSVLIIDPVTNTADTTTISGLTGTGGKWIGGVLAPNGKIYGVPSNSTSVLVINPGLPKHPSWMLKPYFNKF
jgi:hypothetical protein